MGEKRGGMEEEEENAEKTGAVFLLLWLRFFNFCFSFFGFFFFFSSALCFAVPWFEVICHVLLCYDWCL